MGNSRTSRWARPRNGAANHKRYLLRLQVERLEDRHLLAGDPWSWFESFDDVPRIPTTELAQSPLRDPNVIGPHDLVASEWIVQLGETATRRLSSLDTLNDRLDQPPVDFTVISGLGSPGLVLVRGRGVTTDDIESVLASHDDVDSHSVNSIVEGQATPNDPEFAANLLPGLTEINAPAAWDQTIGSSDIVVGVVDGGIDPTHPDLFLNIWLNQGEIPREFLNGTINVDNDPENDRLVDIDGDGLITFYDLNNVRRVEATGIIVVHAGPEPGEEGPGAGEEVDFSGPMPFNQGENRGFVAGIDRNNNDRIDAADLLEDDDWADAEDTDGNTFFDDFFGVNFRAGGNDPFLDNNPSDEFGHGTHVAGTIGAVGNNGFGVTGVNWQTSLMSLRILDNANQSDAGAAIKAINYARTMRESMTRDDQGRIEKGANVRVLNNSWGQPGGYERAFEVAIGDLAEEDILFVAAAGNGNRRGEGVDNDLTPFYPASYEVDNVIAVAALGGDNQLAALSNFGATSVDLAAPGVGVRSTAPGGGVISQTGTSMAAPHVSGAAALVWSALPGATFAEVKQAILGTASLSPIVGGMSVLASGGKLDAAAALDADVFAPSAVLVQKEDITEAGGSGTTFVVRYSHRDGIDLSDALNAKLMVSRQWGPSEADPDPPIAFEAVQVEDEGRIVDVTYLFNAPGSERDFTNENQVAIDEGPPNSITSEINVRGVTEIPSVVTVSLDIQHTYVGDLTMKLIAPDGSEAILVSEEGGSGEDFTDTTFDDDAGISIVNQSAPFTGTFRPLQPISPLAATGANGTWTLEINDTAFEDGGFLNNWSLHFAGQTWDALDFGDYVISTVAGTLSAKDSFQQIQSREIGSFNVRIEDPTVLYVDQFADSNDPGSLRSAINAANAAGQPRTIILDTGTYTIDIPHQRDADSRFPDPDPRLFCGAIENRSGWSDATTGDFDVEADGAITIIGNTSERTIIDAQQRNRAFKVHADASLRLERVMVTGGRAPSDQGGGGILSAGSLEIDRVTIRGNSAVSSDPADPIRGGGIAAWAGTASVSRSWIDANESNFGGGIFYCGTAGGGISQSTLSNNVGGGLHSHSDADLTVDNSTFSANVGGQGAVFNGKRDGLEISFSPDDQLGAPSFSDDGRFVAFASNAANLVPDDTNNAVDIFVYDRVTGRFERVSVSSDGEEARRVNAFFVAQQNNRLSRSPSISGDGRFVAFESFAANLVPNDTNLGEDVFVFDRQTKELVRATNDGVEINTLIDPAFQNPLASNLKPSISGDGSLVVFQSLASNLIPGDNANRDYNVFVYDRIGNSIDAISTRDDGSAFGAFDPAISADGEFIAFASASDELAGDDNNGLIDVFVIDRSDGRIELVSRNSQGQVANGSGRSDSPKLSGDGSVVVFQSSAQNLDDSPPVQFEIYVHDRTRDTTTGVDVSNAGTRQIGFSESPLISKDGRRVAFWSTVDGLVGGDQDGEPDVFVVDLAEQIADRVIADVDIRKSAQFRSFGFSPNGNVIAFESDSSAFTPGDPAGTWDLFSFDLVENRVELITARPPQVSTIALSQVTVAKTETDRVEFSVVGAVELEDVLFARNATVGDFDSDSVTASNAFGSLANDDPSANLIGDLTAFGDMPPVHPLRRGNPAIDSGDPSFVGAVDQRGIRRVVPDIGAFEAVEGSVAGTVFIDRNNNQTRDPGELGIAGFAVSSLADGRMLLSAEDDPRTGGFNEAGSVVFDNLASGRYVFEVNVPPKFTFSTAPLGLAIPRPISADKSRDDAAVSADGGVIVFASNAEESLPGNTNPNDNFQDIFVYDKGSDTTHRVSVTASGDEANSRSLSPVISEDGDVIAFLSAATNLGSNSFNQAFVYNRESSDLQLMSINAAGTQANQGIDSISLSGNGQYIAIETRADNLVGGDNNGVSDIFVFDRNEGLPGQRLRRVSVNSGQQQAIGGDSSRPVISADGRLVAFSSQATNLDNGDDNDKTDVFVYDTVGNTVERITNVQDDPRPQIGPPDVEAVGISADNRFVVYRLVINVRVLDFSVPETTFFLYDLATKSSQPLVVVDQGAFGASLSADGRFLTFSTSSALVPEDTNGFSDVYIYDTELHDVRRLSERPDGFEGRSRSSSPVISSDGRVIVFDAPQQNFEPVGEILFGRDLFITSNPLIRPGGTRQVHPGDVLSNLELGFLPDPGEISGIAFEDLIGNQSFDPGEPVIPDLIVFLDEDGDGVLDAGEPSTVTDDQGGYRFTGLESFRTYTIVGIGPIGFEQVSPIDDNRFAWEVFLPPGGDVSGRDFGFRKVVGSGQSSSNSSIRVRVEDQAGNPQRGIRVFLDANDSGTKESNERALETDANGNILFGGLGTGIFAVRTQFRDQDFVHVSPLGSTLSSFKEPAIGELTIDSKPQTLELADFNGDGFPDAVIALPASDTIVIRINDQQGGFTDQVIKIDPSPNSVGSQFVQAAPVALAVGHFNGSTAGNAMLDLAVVNNFNDSVLVLTDFNGSGFERSDFASVGAGAFDIAAVTIDGDPLHQHLVVANSVDHTIQFLHNAGDGTFIAQNAVASGGSVPVALVVGDFGGGAAFDIAVVNRSSPNSAFGNVRIFSGDTDGVLAFASSDTYLVQGNPVDIVAANFDGDAGGHLDLAIANADSGSVSILIGNGDGTFSTQPDSRLLGGNEGLTDLATGDIDNDDDIDIIAGDSKNFDVLIFRNRSKIPGQTDFEPAEAQGLGEVPFTERVPIAVANFDLDQSGTGERGTIDIVAVATERVGPTLKPTAMLQVLSNRLGDGAVRVETDGTNAAPDVTFVIRPDSLPPSLDPIPNPDAIDEDDGPQQIPLTGITRGRPNALDLMIEAEIIEAESNPPDLIESLRVDPVAGGASTVRFTTAGESSGQAVVMIRVIDPGADGQFDLQGEPFPDDVTIKQSFTVTVNPVNDPPTFEVPAALSIHELEAGGPLVVMPGLATGISVGGGADEAAGQTLSGFSLTTDNDAAFAVPPTIDVTGQLTFRAVADFAGTVTVQVSLSDDGGTVNGGRDTTRKTLVINVLPVNDRPTITLGANQSAVEGSGLQTVVNFATGFSPGGGSDETGQTISDFVVTHDNPGLFRVQPDIGIDGTLSYVPAAVADGTATVTVQVRDSGGTERGGTDLSLAQTFEITVTGVPDTTPPLPVITTDQPNLTNQKSFEVTIDFGEPVSGFTAADITASDATVGDPQLISGGRYTVSITKTTDGAVTIDVPAGAVADAANNASLAAAESLTITVDSTALVPQLATNQPSLTSNGSFDIFIDFGEPVTGFQLSDLIVVNATPSNLQDIGGGRYSVTITSDDDGQVVALVPAGAARDAADNVSLTSGLLKLLVDTTNPAPVLRSFVPTPTSLPSFDVDLDFGEPVTGLTQDDLTLSSGSIERVIDLGKGRYLIRLVHLIEGNFTLSLGAGAANDVAGNESLAATDLVVTIEFAAPTSIILEGSGETLALSQTDLRLDAIELIDIRGTGNNTLLLSAARIRDEFPNSQVLVVSDAGDEVVFDAGWTYDHEAIVENGRLIRQFSNAGARLNLAGPRDFSNPIDVFDVNGDGDVTSLDALQVINELGRRVFSSPSGQIRSVDQIDPSGFRFYDVTADSSITSLDALRVINALGRRGNPGAGESVVLTSFAALDDEDTWNDTLGQAYPETLAADAKRTGMSGTGQAASVPCTAPAIQKPVDTEELEPELVDAVIAGLLQF